jgi:purine-nucleoside phosphorylase
MRDEQIFERAGEAAELIAQRTALRPRIAIVLGSGLGDFANELADAAVIPYGEIPNFPLSTAIGHAGKLVIGNLAKLPLAVMQGRSHFYEGYSFSQITFPVRVLHRLGVKALVLTNAAGGISPEYGQGALVLVRDHINLLGGSPLIGPNETRFGPRFPDMTYAYDREYRSFAKQAARQANIPLFEGIYAAMHGPSYETPAEIQMLARVGADLVGMSTVPEVIVARHMDIRVLAISCVTNMAAGLSGETINHEEVLETGRRVKGTFLTLLRAVLPQIAATVA